MRTRDVEHLFTVLLAIRFCAHAQYLHDRFSTLNEKNV